MWLSIWKIEVLFLQLRIEQRRGRVFEGWNEGKIYFPPTYKYSNNSDRYSGDDMHPKEKRRTPAWYVHLSYPKQWRSNVQAYAQQEIKEKYAFWNPYLSILVDSQSPNWFSKFFYMWRCDRILWYGGGLHQLSYVRGESRFSDHRPVYSIFWAEVESVNNRLKKSTSYSSSRSEVEDFLPYSHGYTELSFFWRMEGIVKNHNQVCPLSLSFSLLFLYILISVPLCTSI